MNELHFGDNLDVLRGMDSDCVDLIYLDPPFNSNADYNLLYGTRRGGPSQSQAHAFEDTWTWGPDAQRALNETADRHLQAGTLLDAFQRIFDGSNMMAYLAMMAVRMIELHRVLKPTGSLYPLRPYREPLPENAARRDFPTRSLSKRNSLEKAQRTQQR